MRTISSTTTTSSETHTSARTYGVVLDGKETPVRFTVTHTLITRNGIIDIESVDLVADMSEAGFKPGIVAPHVIELVRKGRTESFGGLSYQYTGAGHDRELFSVSWSAFIDEVFYSVELLND